MTKSKETSKPDTSTRPTSGPTKPDQIPAEGKEIGGPKGPEPTRFGDWEQKGRCSDF